MKQSFLVFHPELDGRISAKLIRLKAVGCPGPALFGLLIKRSPRPVESILAYFKRTLPLSKIIIYDLLIYKQCF